MTEMIITPEAHKIGAIAKIAIGESKKYIRRAAYYIKADAGTAESGEHIYEAIYIREESPIRK